MSVKTNLKYVMTLTRKDLRIELRTKVTLPIMLVFSIIVLVIFNFVFNSEPAVFITVAEGILWTAYTFSGLLGLNRVFSSESNQDNLGGLMLLPINRTVIFWSKFLSSTVYMLLLAAIITPVFLILFNFSLFQPGLHIPKDSIYTDNSQDVH